MLEKIRSDIATMQAIGHKARQVAGGTSYKTCQAENLMSFATRCPPGSAPRNEIRASAPIANPLIPTATAPEMRSERGVRSQMVAAQSANALHMLME